MQKDVISVRRHKTSSVIISKFSSAFNRWMSDENGFVVFLCPDCHTESPTSAHKCRDTDLYLKRRCQAAYEKNHTRDEFMRLVGRNYL